MRIRILGSAAGGGLPQWNCNCPNCVRARAGHLPSRLQSGLAVCADDASGAGTQGERWFLLNASPDLPLQISRAPSLHPHRAEGSHSRESPIHGVLVTNADLDHTLGLLMLREGNAPIPVHTSTLVRDALDAGLQLSNVLHAFCGVCWITPPLSPSPLRDRDGQESGLSYRCIPLAGQPPRFARSANATVAHSDSGHVLAFEIIENKTGQKLVYAPDLEDWNDALKAAVQDADIVFCDGTFWSASEMIDLGISTRSAREMGHLPVEESLPILAGLKARSFYIHINNTNPILDPQSQAHKAVVQAGIAIAQDGQDLTL